jgi:hypothetical protein
MRDPDVICPYCSSDEDDDETDYFKIKGGKYE